MIQMTEIQYYFCVFMIAFWSFCIGFIIGEANEKNKKIVMKQKYIIDKALKDILVSWFENIEELSSKLTSGNVSHQGATIRNKAIRCSKFIKEHCKTKEE